jgi:hypothetical protein
MLNTILPLFLSTLLAVAAHSPLPAAEGPAGRDGAVIQDQAGMARKLAAIEAALEKAHLDKCAALSAAVETLPFYAKDVARQTIALHGDGTALFGAFQAIEKLATIRLGSSLLSVVYLYKLKESATVWTFGFYHDGAEWRLVSMGVENVTAFLERSGKPSQLGASFIPAPGGQ